ncbi:DUF3564 family protein [Paraburkholderia sp. BL10I2N1]|uniref:DUF3564 family protein n=1 Tax=Paraburkholderia sp. BL10I2N1 TaxID=1938796 RepID=UPI003261604C
MEAHKWSREGHVGLDLPEWGAWIVDHGNTFICAPHDTRPLCILDGLDMSGQHGPFEGETGTADWCGNQGPVHEQGHWHVQCVDPDAAVAEHGVFADDDVA